MKSKKISENSNIAEIVEQYPELMEVLTLDYGFHCIGCHYSEMETLGEGAVVHGMSKKEIREMVNNLNELLAKGFDNKT